MVNLFVVQRLPRRFDFSLFDLRLAIDLRLAFRLDSRDFRLSVILDVYLGLLFSRGCLLFSLFRFARRLFLLSDGSLLRRDDFLDRTSVIVARSVLSSFLFRLKRYGRIVLPSAGCCCCCGGGGGRRLFWRSNRGGVNFHLRLQVRRLLLLLLLLRLQIVQLVYCRSGNRLRLFSLCLRCGVSCCRRRRCRLFHFCLLRDYVQCLLLLFGSFLCIHLRLVARRLEFFLQSFNLLRRSFVLRDGFGSIFRRLVIRRFWNIFRRLVIRRFWSIFL